MSLLNVLKKIKSKLSTVYENVSETCPKRVLNVPEPKTPQAQIGHVRDTFRTQQNIQKENENQQDSLEKCTDVSSSNINNNINIKNINKTTTTKIVVKNTRQRKKRRAPIRSLSGHWRQINVEPLAHIGLTRHHLLELSKHNGPSVVRDSINQFAYALKHGKQKYSDPLKVFLSVMRRGDRWIEPSYTAHQNAEQTRIKKNTEREDQSKKSNQALLVSRLVDERYPRWRLTLTDEQITQILPPELRGPRLRAGKEALLKKHLADSIIIPELRQKGVL